jgi:signal transduction histidine kinase
MHRRPNLLIRHKLHLLVVIPLTGMLLATAPLVVDRVQQASRASELAALMDTADRIGALVQDVQQERLLSIAYLASPKASPNAVVVQSALVTGATADLRRALGTRLTPELARALDGVGGLDPVRGQVLRQAITPNRLNARFDGVVSALIDAIGLIPPRAEGTAGTAELSALDALFRADQYRGTGGAALLASVAAPAGAAGALGTVDRAGQAEAVEVARFKQLATPEQARLFRLAEFGTASALVNDLQGQIEADRGAARNPEPAPTGADRMALVDRLADAVTAQYGLRVLVEEKIAHDLADRAKHSAHTETVAAVGFGIAIEALVIVVVLLSVSIRRSVSEPLRGLTEAALEVADLAETELRRVADTDENGPRAPMPRLAAVRVTTQDEVGILAAAFNRVQGTSARLLERQILSRRNVAAMYGSIGRRTQNLVRQQLALIDALEAAELDEERLGHLFLLDHFASRLQRSANSLIVLSGTPYGTDSVAAPLSLHDAIRAALGGIDDYRRVRLESVAEDLLRPGPAGDVVLVLGELMANAASFSPPETDVEVAVSRVGGGRCVRIVDHGMGMPPARMERENVRLVSRERLDLAPTDLLGLFVVGRLARRHGLTVTLTETEGGGVTVYVLIPDALFLPDRDLFPAQPPDSVAGIENSVAEAIRRAMKARSGNEGPEVAVSQNPDSAVPAWQPCLDPGTVPFPLEYRTPGAQLASRTGSPPPTPPDPPADPDAVRAELEAFEAGVARAALYEQRIPER